MNSKKNLLVKVLLAMMLAICSIAFIGCGKKDKKPVSYGEAGIYSIYDAEEEYQLSLDKGKYTLTLGETHLAGKYSYDGTTLNLYAEGEGNTIIGTIEDTMLTISYNGEIYKFYKNVNYTVNYDVDGGDAMQSTTVVNGMTLTKPADPTKAGHYFVGWYADKAYTTPFAFDSTIITADVTLYARFVAQSSGANEYTATLYVDGQVLESKTTVNGVLYGLPTPTKADDTFVGWWMSDYQQADKLTSEYKSEQVLVQNVNLYAVWASNGLTVSVNAEGIVWSAIKTGVEYTVTVAYEGTVIGQPYSTTALTMAYDFASSEAGEYTITVEGDGKTAVAYYSNKALARVSNFMVNESSLVFNAVANAEKYVIAVVCGDGAHEYDNGNSATYNFAECAMKEGGIEFVVKAMANGYITSVSETFVYNLQLDAVDGVAYDATTGELTWGAVENASGYVVTVTVGGVTETYTVSENTLDMKKYTGEVAVTVKAVCSGYNSMPATEYTCTIATLSAPVVTFAQDMIFWTAVDGAASYVVKIGDKEYPVAEGTEFALPAECKVKGTTYAVSVKAVSDDAAKNSFYSDEISYTYGEIAELTYSCNYLQWNSVGGAQTYTVKLNGEVVANLNGEATQTAITFAKAGANVLTLYAYDNAGAELDSAEISVDALQISLEVQGGSAVANVFAAVGDTLALPESTLEGYDLAGWYTEANGAGSQFTANDTVSGTMTLYAYWTPAAYEVELKIGKVVFNEETGAYAYVVETYATEIVHYMQNFTLSVPTYEDGSKMFAGWYEDDTRTSYQYTDAEGNSTGIWTKLGGHTLFAGWADVLSYELFEDASGKSWHVIGGEGTKNATEITVPAVHTDPVTKAVYPVTEIKTRAFAECKALVTLNIPDTLKSIFLAFGSTTSTFSTGSALYECRNLMNINVYCVDEDGEHDEYSKHETYYSSVDGLLIRHASPVGELEYGVELAFVPFAKSGTIVVPDVVEHIPQRTFYSMPKLKAVIIPASVGRIGDRAFYGSATEEIIFEEAPAGVEEKTLLLSEGALNVVDNLTKIVLPTRIGDIDLHETNMFSHNFNLLSFEIKGRPTPEQKANNAYYTSVDGVICNYDGTKLVYVSKFISGTFTIPASIEVIGEKAFNNTYTSEDSASKLECIIIKDNVKTIESNAIVGYPNLRSIVFDYERGSLSIASKAFYGLENISEIVLPEQLAYVGSHAFGGMTKLQTVTINGASDATLEWGVFAEEGGRNKGYVTTVNLGANAPAFEVNSVFYGCQLYVLNIDKNNANYNVDDQGVLYNEGATTILYYPFGLTGNYVIPETVKTIGDGVFENRANIKSIEIPANVTSISFNAFKNCVALETLTFAPRTEDLYISPSAFANCIALTSVSLPEGMRVLEGWVFANCSNITTVHIPATMDTFILADAFYGCKKIKTVTVADANPYYGIEDGILYQKNGADLVSVLFVPEILEGAVVIPSTVTSIGEGMFRGKTKITSIAFENNTASPDLILGDSVFEGMTSLTDVRLPDGLAVIPTNAFKGSSITSVYVPASVVEVMPGAFANCKKLENVTIADGDMELVFANATLVTGAFYNTPKLTSITLPNRMATIGKYMFAYSSVSNIVFPECLDVIGEGAFANNKSIKNLAMPNSVTMVESFAFSGCTALETVTLSEQLTSIPDYLFGEAMAGTGAGGSSSGGGKDEGGRDDGGVPIKPPAPERANKYPQYRDSGKDEGGKDDIIVDDGTVRLTEDVGAATALKSIIIPEFVETIGLHAFHGCTALATVTFASQENLFTLSDYAFAESGLTAFAMPNSVNAIGSYLLAGCTKLVTLSVSESATSIPAFMCGEQTYDDMMPNIEAFAPCSSLTAVTIPASITEIGDGAFKNASALKNVIFAAGTAIENIGVSAFEGTGIASLDLSDASAATITFGAYAFAKSALKEVKLPISISDLGTAFIGCANIETFEIASDGDGDISNDLYNVDAESLVVYNGDKTELRLYLGNATEFTVPDTVKVIKYNAFRGNRTLTKVTIPVSVATIEDAAFAFCSSLKTVVIPDNSALTSIGFRAFAYSSIEEITLPASITSMGKHTYKVGAPVGVDLNDYMTGSNVNNGWDSTSSSSGWHGRVFEECINLKKVVVNTTKLCEYMFYYCVSLSDLTLNDNTPELLGYTFQHCKALTSFTFPSKLTKVRAYEFANSGITSIHIPAGITFNSRSYTSGTRYARGVAMFMGCNNLTVATMAEGYTILPPRMFDGTAIKTFTFPASVQQICDSFLAGCAELEEIIMPDTVKNLQMGAGVFNGDIGSNKLTEIDFSGITSLTFSGGAVFANSLYLKSVILPDSVTSFSYNVFNGCENLETVVAKGVTSIGGSCFQGCYKLENVTLSDNLTSIGASAFQNCYALKEMNIPDTVTDLGERAFRNSGLEKVTIGSGITYIPSYAFMGAKLKTVHIHAGVTMIEPSAFLGCSELESFTVDAANSNYKTGNCGELYDSTNILMFFPAASSGENGTFTMPTMSILGVYAFYGAKNLDTVVVSPATSVIPTGAFQNSLISSIELTNNITRIGAFAFKNCTNLVSIDLPDSIVDPMENVETPYWITAWLETEYFESGEEGMFPGFDENFGIGQAAFEGCTSLTTVHLPKYMIKLAPELFKGCTSLKTIELPYGLEIISHEAFAGSGLVEIVIPETVVTIGTFKDLMAGGKDEGGKKKGETVLVYGSVFANCTSLKSVVFTNPDVEIFMDAFIGCTGLESVTFANGWRTISDGMFKDCTSLNIELPATIETIGADAFAGWTAEQTITISMPIEKANMLWGEGWNGGATVVVKE